MSAYIFLVLFYTFAVHKDQPPYKPQPKAYMAARTMGTSEKSNGVKKGISYPNGRPAQVAVEHLMCKAKRVVRSALFSCPPRGCP